MARVVDGDDDKIRAVFQQGSSIAVERGETAFVFTERIAVYTHLRAVIRSSGIQNRPPARPRMVLEGFLVPDRPLVHQQLGTLRVAVAVNVQGCRGGEIVLAH